MFPLSSFGWHVGYLFLLGTIFGSFGNVLICRLPKDKGIGGRSHCPHCHRILRMLDLIPILSYLCLRGRCHTCRKPISVQYPLVEFVCGVLFATGVAIGLSFWQAVLFGLCLWLLFLIAIIDAQTQLIPDALNIPFVGIALLFSLLTDRFDLIALVVAVGFLGVQWIVSGGKWVGSGDIILIAGIALLIGPWQHVVLAVLLAYIFGGVAAAILLTTGTKTRKDALAFAPFLVLGAYATVFYGQAILWEMMGIL